MFRTLILTGNVCVTPAVVALMVYVPSRGPDLTFHVTGLVRRAAPAAGAGTACSAVPPTSSSPSGSASVTVCDGAGLLTYAVTVNSPLGANEPPAVRASLPPPSPPETLPRP